MDNSPPENIGIQLAGLVTETFQAMLDQGKISQFVQRDETQLDGSGSVVGVVRDTVSSFDNLGFQGRSFLVGILIHACCLAFQHLEAEVQAGMRLITDFQFLGNRQCVLVVRKSPLIFQAEVKSIFTSMAKRWMTDVMKQCQGFDEIFVQP